MNKTLSILTLVVGMLVFGLSAAHAAVPVVDGVISPGTEWNNTGNPYYLEVFDVNEADNQIDNMDIKHAVVLQELTSFSGDGDFSNDGIYLLIEVYAPPPSLAYATGVGVVPTTQPIIFMQGDLLGDGLSDGFNIFLRHYNTDPTTGLAANDSVGVCVGSLLTCSGIGAVYTDLTSAGGSHARGSVLEYFIPSGTFGTPPSPPGTPFPFTFIGSVTYDNGASGPNTSDDVVIGQLPLIPEPGTMFLMLSGLLGMFGIRFKK